MASGPSLKGDPLVLNQNVSPTDVDVQDLIPQLERNTGRAVRIANPVEFSGPVKFLSRPETQVQNGTLSSTTPAVKDISNLKLVNTAPVTITDFTLGQEGHQLFVYGDGQTTITHGTKIKTNTGANKLLAADQIYIFVKISSVWIESAVSGTTYTAGAGISLPANAITNLYVGKAVTLFTGSILHTSGGAGYEEFPNTVKSYNAIVDLTSMNNCRMVAVTTAHTGSPVLKYQYSTNGSSWNDLFSSLTKALSTDGNQVTAITAIVAGAKIATCYLRAVIDNSGGSTVTVTFLQFEFTP